VRLVINCSDIKATGATQVSISFINECIRHTGNEYFVFASSTIARQLEIDKFPSNFHFYIFDYKPFFNKMGLKSWRKLIELEKIIRPDCVFSVFGPSVWKPSAPHLMGYAYPYYVYPESPFFSIISAKRRFKIKLHKAFHKYYLERNGEHYVCETEDVSRRLPGFIRCKTGNIYTVTNSYNHFFRGVTSSGDKMLPLKADGEFRFVTLSSFADHKNLIILDKVIPLLLEKYPGIYCSFVLTIDETLFQQSFSKIARSRIINLGRIRAADCPKVYDECDAMFLPTLMECFSASYAESMKMGKPVLTSDLAFAHTVCQDAAVYFNPMDPDEIAFKIYSLVTDPILQKKMVLNGHYRLAAFDTPETRAFKYLEFCKQISKK
jgi:glycosyltransferase involved in cell wall biosynthesis